MLDRLLEDDRIAIEAISGTSAGAMNAVVLADGMMRGGRQGARERLRIFWQEVSRTGAFSPIRRSMFDMFTGNWSFDHSLSFFFFDTFMRSVSPYDFNPFNVNPLRDTIAESRRFREGEGSAGT